MRELNEKQIKFCEEYITNGFNGTAAYRIVYEPKNDNVAAVEAHRMLSSSKFIEKIKEIEGSYCIAGHKVGINRQAIMSALRKMLEAKKIVFYEGGRIDEVDDFIAINNAITTYAKLTGDFAPEKKDIKFDDNDGVDVTKMNKEEREAYKVKILAEL